MGFEYRVALAKEDFKFSAAHFTVFSREEAELLHGHNYRVRVEVSGDKLDDLGFLVDFDQLKASIRSECAALDSLTLIPRLNPFLQVVEEDGQVEIGYESRSYRLPAEEVVLMDLVNTTVELFARFFWDRLAPTLKGTSVQWLQVGVEETDGQSCTYESEI